MKFFFFSIVCSLVLFSCSRIEKKAKETVNKGGELVGETATEFIEGVNDGVEKSKKLKVNLSDSLKTAISIGKVIITNDSLGNKNVLQTYISFQKDFSDTLTLKVFDENKLEYGRVSATIEGKSNEARFYDFTFDPRTELEMKSTFRLEK